MMIINRKRITKLNITIKYDHIIQRQMLRTAFNNTVSLVKSITSTVSVRSMGINTAFDFRSQAGKQYAPDKIGLHTGQATAICDQPGCEVKRCVTPCGKLIKMEVDGNYSHKPPQGMSSVFLDSVDYQGKQKDQYFVKAGTKPQITADQMKDLTENDLTPNKAATNYALNGDILDKIK